VVQSKQIILALTRTWRSASLERACEAQPERLNLLRVFQLWVLVT
jgi:hypothetical protein